MAIQLKKQKGKQARVWEIAQRAGARAWHIQEPVDPKHGMANQSTTAKCSPVYQQAW